VTSVADVSFDEGNRTGSNAMIQMEQAGVTTIVCFCHTSDLVYNYYPKATSADYYPEWLHTNYGHQDDDFAASTWPRDQATHSFGIQSFNKIAEPSQTPSYWAIKSVATAYSSATNDYGWIEYEDLLLYAS